jgi:excisionase family DNA binding protein
MSISEAASRLNVSTDSVRRRLRNGMLHGERDGRGQWWLDLPANIQPERPSPSVDERLVLGGAEFAQEGPGSADLLLKSLQTTIDDLRSRLDRSERERREDQERAAAERDRLLTLIEEFARGGAVRGRSLG